MSITKTREVFSLPNVHYADFFVNRATNANAESFNAKVKAFRAQFRGVTDIPFFLYRLMKLCAEEYRLATGF